MWREVVIKINILLLSKSDAIDENEFVKNKKGYIIEIIKGNKTRKINLNGI